MAAFIQDVRHLPLSYLIAAVMQVFFWLFSGLVLGWIFLAFARSRGRNERYVYAFGLVVAALIYLVFALFGSNPVWWIIEVTGIVLYGVFAWLGLRYSVIWLSAGWFFHLFWDAGLHLAGSGSDFVPASYAMLCISFDLLVSVTIIWRFISERTHAGTA